MKAKLDLQLHGSSSGSGIYSAFDDKATKKGELAVLHTALLVQTDSPMIIVLILCHQVPKSVKENKTKVSEHLLQEELLPFDMSIAKTPGDTPQAACRQCSY